MSWSGTLRAQPLGRDMFRWNSAPIAFDANALRGKWASLDRMSRFQCAMAASFLLHAFVLFGVAIRPPDPVKLDATPPPLEVVLVNAKSKTRPVKADALAQRNLDGGGNTDADQRAKSPLPVVRDDPRTSELAAQSRRVEQLDQGARNLMTQTKSVAKVEVAPPKPQQQVEETRATPTASDLMSRSVEMIRLEAQIAKDLEAYQKRPRRKFVGARTSEIPLAAYIDAWRIKVERVGTLNFPQAARDQKIYGALKLTVSIKADGTVENVEINTSSGHKLLDDAALRIVHLAGPYAAFPSNIAKDTDILSITRWWSFTRSDSLSTE